VDSGLQDLQGKAERVKPPELRRLLDEFRREKAALRDRHVANAAAVGQYDRNNAYQYIVAREDTQLAWVRDALRELDAAMSDTGLSAAPGAGNVASPPSSEQDAPGNDARDIEEFVARWRPRIGSVSNARIKLMLELTLGEMLEQARLFRQAAAGIVDLLGKRTGGARTEGRVISTRRIE
jgi:hypothetical protein